jgi:hypothetical protein
MSKFSRLLEEAKQGKESPALASSKPVPAKAKAKANKPTAREGKATGRRSDPNYVGVFAYIPKTLNEDVKTLLVKNKEHDFSSLVETLLQQWLSKQR